MAHVTGYLAKLARLLLLCADLERGVISKAVIIA